MKEHNGEVLNFDRKTKCDWCGHTEICAVCHIGTTNYNRLVCVECAVSMNENQRNLSGYNLIDMNNSTIRFGDNLVYDCTKESECE